MADRPRREHDPLADRDPPGRIHPVGDGHRRDIGPLRRGPTAGLGLELPL